MRAPLLLLVGLLCTVGAPAAADAPATIEALGWLAGCWARTDAEAGSGEFWTAPAGGTMLGASRTVRDGRTVAHEFVRIGPAGDGVLTYHAHPSGQAPAAFRLARLEPRLAVFENAAHDFPQRIGYRRLADDTLLAWIEGEQRGRPRRLEFPMRRTPCPGGAAPLVARRDEDA